MGSDEVEGEEGIGGKASSVVVIFFLKIEPLFPPLQSFFPANRLVTS